MSKKLIRDLANKYGLTTKEVEQAVNSQFKFVAKKIEEGNFSSVRLPYFGIFKPNMKQKAKYDAKDKTNAECDFGGED